jgi:polyisoprenoid-binding protein YceI
LISNIFYHIYLTFIKMKKLFFFALLAVVGFMSFTKPAPTPFVVDAAKSTFKWTGKKVTGSHWGYIKFSAGTINVEKGALVGGTFTVDMNSIDCQDLQPGKGQEKLVGHLKADDFFGTATFPTSTLTIKSATAQGSNLYDVKADLTIKGITSEITFPATVSIAGGALTAAAKFNIDRTKFGIKYGSGSFFENLGDKAINNEFEVEINVVANGQAAAAAPAAKKKAAMKVNKTKKAAGTGK